MQATTKGGVSKPKKPTLIAEDGLKKAIAKIPKAGAETKVIETALEKVGNGGDIEVDIPLQAVQTFTANSI